MIRNWIFPGVLLAFILGVVFPDLALQGWVIALGDVPDQFLPWREFVSSEFHQGAIPLWNRYAWCGTPFLANMQSAVLYPIDRFFDLLASPGRALSLGLVFHLWLGGMLLYAFCRHLGAGVAAGLAAALGYSLGGFHAIHLLGGNLLTVTSSIYLPGHLLAAGSLVGRMHQGRSIGWVPFWGIILWSLQILSGHAQMTFYNGIFTLVFLAFNLAFAITERSPVNGSSKPLQSSGRWIARVIGMFLLMGGITFLVAAPQILPTLEYRSFCARAGTLPFDSATEFSLGWEVLLSFLLPEYLGTRAARFSASGIDTYWGDWKNWSAVYIGIFPFLGLTGLAIWRKKEAIPNRAVKALAGLALVGLFLALGRNNPLYHLVHQLPIFGQFRAPSKFIPALVVPVAVLGSLGLSALLDWLSAAKSSPHLPGWGRWCLIVAGSGVALLVIFPNVRTPGLPAELAGHDLLRGLILVLGFIGLASVCISLPFRSVPWGKRQLIAALLILLSALDMGLYARKYVISAPPEDLKYLPGAWIRGHLQEGERVLTTPEFTGVNQTTPERIPVPGGYDPLQVGLYIDTFRKNGAIPPGAIVDLFTPPLEWAGKLGASLVVSRQLLKNPSLAPLDRHEGWMLYRVKDPAPMIEFIPENHTVDSPGGATLEGEWKLHDLSVRGIVPCEGRIVIRQVYTPGWQCFNKDQEAVSVDVEEPFWQKVRVSQGEVSLTLSYRPAGWRWGLCLFPAGLLGLIGMAFLALKSRKTELNEMGGCSQ